MRNLLIFIFLLTSIYSFSKDCKQDSISIQRLDSIALGYYKNSPDSALVFLWQALRKCEKLTCDEKTKDFLTARIYTSFANTFYYKSDYLLSLEYYYQSLQLFLKQKYFFEAAGNYHQIGICQYELDNNTLAISNLNSALMIYEMNDSLSFASKSLLSIGASQVNLGNFQDALGSFLKSMKYKEEVNDVEGINNCLMNIGAMHKLLKNYKDALKYFEQAYKNYTESDNKMGQGQTLNNIGLVYRNLGDFSKADSYLNKALKIYIELGNIKKQANVYNNLGANALSQKKYAEALKYFNKYYEIVKSRKEYSNIATALFDLGTIDKELGHYNEAIAKYQRADMILDSLKILMNRDQIYYQLAKTYELKSDYKRAVDMYKMYNILSDSLYSMDRIENMNEMEKRYQGEKKQKEIELQQEQLLRKNTEIEVQKEVAEKQRLIRNGLIIFMFLALFILYAIYRNFAQKKRLNHILMSQKNEIEAQRDQLSLLNTDLLQKNEEIKTQRDEIESQRDLVQFQKGKIEHIHKEQTDSIIYAKRIQKAVITPMSVLNEAFKETFLIFKPRNIVSGDFYWCSVIGKWKLFCVADCTGHGVPGAFMSMLGISILNEWVKNKQDFSSNEILNNLRSQIVNSLKQSDMHQDVSSKMFHSSVKDGMDIAFCVFNTETHELQFSGANSSLYILKKANKVNEADSSGFELEEIKGDKMPIAIHVTMNPFSSHKIQISNDDTLYLMSDGYVDQFGGSQFKEQGGKKFMKSRLKSFLEEIGNENLNNQKQILEKELSDWMQDFEQMDDITLMGVKLL